MLLSTSKTQEYNLCAILISHIIRFISLLLWLLLKEKISNARYISYILWIYSESLSITYHESLR